MADIQAKKKYFTVYGRHGAAFIIGKLWKKYPRWFGHVLPVDDNSLAKFGINVQALEENLNARQNKMLDLMIVRYWEPDLDELKPLPNGTKFEKDNKT